MRRAVGVALLDIGANPKLVMPLLKDADPSTRLDISCELLRRGYERKNVVTLFVEDFLRRPRASSFYCQEVFGWIGKNSIAISAPLLVKTLGGRNQNKREAAFDALMELRQVPPVVVNPLVRLADDPRTSVALHAVAVLGEAGSAAHKPLLKLFKDKRALIEVEVLTSLGKLNPQDPNVHKRLKQIASDKQRPADARAAKYSLNLLEGWAVEGRYTRPVPKAKRKAVTAKPDQLARQLASQNLKIRLEACESLFRLQPKNHQIAPALIKVLTKSDPKLRLKACDLIAKMKLTATVTAPHLAKLLGSREIIPYGPNQLGGRSLSWAAATALRSLGQVGVKAFIPVLKHKKSEVRGMAASWLGSMGKEATPAIPHLVARLDDKGTLTVAISSHVGVAREVRMMAADALGELGPAAKIAVPKLIQMLQINEVEIHAVRALGEIGCSPQRVIPPLLKIPTDSSYLAIAIVTTLHKLDPMHSEIVPRLRRILKRVGKQADIINDYFLRMRDVGDVIIQIGRRGHLLKPELVDLAVLHEFMVSVATIVAANSASSGQLPRDIQKKSPQRA